MPAVPKRLNVFERYLSLWVGLCMAVGVVLGLTAPGMMQGVRSLEFGAGSQINVAIAILIWLMITPMMMKVDFWSIQVVLYSVLIFIVIPLAAGVVLRQWFMRTKGRV